MRILVIEDEEKTAAYLRKGLSEQGFVVDVCVQGDDGLFTARTTGYELIILDPPSYARSGESSFEVAKDLSRTIEASAVLLAPKGTLLVSTNHRGTSRRELEGHVRRALGERKYAQKLPPLPEDFPMMGEAFVKSCIATLGQ